MIIRSHQSRTKRVMVNMIIDKNALRYLLKVGRWNIIVFTYVKAAEHASFLCHGKSGFLQQMNVLSFPRL